MRSGPKALASVVIVSAIAGCVTSNPLPAPAAQTIAPVAFDGTYRGSIRLTSSGISGGQTSWCDTPPAISLSLQKGSFNYVLVHPNVPKDSAYSMSPNFAVTVAPDGSFTASSQNGEAQMVGQITGSHLVGRIDGSACGYAFTADRS
jgi:hypothetical protein